MGSNPSSLFASVPDHAAIEAALRNKNAWTIPATLFKYHVAELPTDRHIKKSTGHADERVLI